MSKLNPGISPLPLAAIALRVRHMRNEVLGAELFADPAWDCLLTLHVRGPATLTEIAERTGNSVGVTGRWLRLLEDRGLVEQGGGSYGLSPSANAAIDNIFDAVVSAPGMEA